MSRNLYPMANRAKTIGVPLGHQNGDESFGTMFVTERNIDSELLAPMGFFPRRQFFRSGFFPLNPASADFYEAPPWFYMGPNIIGRRTTQAGAPGRIRNQTYHAGMEVSGG